MPPIHRLPSAFCAAFLLCLAASPVQALQLGETRDQLLARHGAPGAEDRAKNVAAYFWDGWSAQLEFQGDVVRKLTYRRNWYLGDPEIASLLASNGGADHWQEISGPDAPARQWRRDDGASATCGRAHPLSIVFQAPGLAAAYQQGPKIVAAPSTPAPSTPSARQPTFPKLLGASPEPELPAADPAPGPTVTTSVPADTAAESVRLSQASETASVSPPAAATEIPGVEAKPPMAKTAVEPKVIVPVEKAAPTLPVPVSPPVAPAAPARASHLFGGVLASFALLGVLAGGAVFFVRRRAPAVSGKVPPARMQSARSKASEPSRQGVPDLNMLRHDQIELLVGEVFRREGYTVELSAALNTEDGIDLMLRRDGETTLVQCKHWRAEHVTEREVREFYGAMAAGGVPRGMLVTTGEITPDAREFAKGKGIEVVDGPLLGAVMGGVAKPGENLCAVSGWLDDFVSHARIYDPECAICHGTMILHTNRVNGAAMWNCRTYPRCPGRREPRADLLSATAAAH
jgi:restriction system protein